MHLDFEEMLLLFFVISCADNTIGGSKKKDLSRFTHSLDLVSFLQLSLRHNNDDYKDKQTNISDEKDLSFHSSELNRPTTDQTAEGNTTDNARLLNEETKSLKTTTKTVDKNVSVDTEISHEADGKISNTNNKPEDKDSKSDEPLSLPRFMQSLEETIVNNTKSTSHSVKSRRSLLKKRAFRRDIVKITSEATTPKDPWQEVVKLKRTNAPAPYLLGKDTTSLLEYKVLTAKRDRRRHVAPMFFQTELNDTGVVVAAMDVVGPMPDFKLPKERRQYRVDSDYEYGEGASAVSGDNDALEPR